MTGPVVSACTTCGARIIWCRTETGKRMPVDAAPAADGNLVLSDGLLPTARSVSRAAALQRDVATYRSHFATCRHAAQHRHPAKGGARPGRPTTGRDLFSDGDDR